MKRKLQIITGASAASLLVLTSLAQDTTNSNDYVPNRMSHVQRTASLKDTAKASDLIGITVKNNQDEKLGKVEDLALDVESGRIVQVIISTGGFMGMGSTLVAVPPAAFQYDAAHKMLHLDASKEKLAGAPKFDASNWDEDTQSNRVAEVYGYYGQQPYFVAESDGTRTTNIDGTFARTLPRNMDGTINTAGASTMDTAHNIEVASDVEATTNNVSTRNPDGTWTRHYYANGNGVRASRSNLGYVQKASKLMGAAVKNPQNEKLGKVENLIVDLPAGRIVAVVISSGGFLGMDNELSAVPPTALRYNSDHDVLQLDASKDMLANSPHFQANQWPDFSQPAYAGGVYQAYKVEPYFNADAANAPDNTSRNVRDRNHGTLTPLDQGNTSRNVRDRNHGTLTPLDQGNSQADINTTASIRKEIMADNDMSTNAKNVKVITMDGHVTLRGPVNTTEEKRLIGEIANRIVQSQNVDNQLEVQITTSSNN